MIFSNKLDIQAFFNELKTKYCIVKMSNDFPNYCTNSDIDIFCYDIKSFINELILFFNEEIQNGWKFKLNEIDKHHIQADFYPPVETDEDLELDIRFDLYSELPMWKHVNVKKSFFVYCLENKMKNEKNIFVPSMISDCILRYIEFVEYYEIRADKIKHADYIIDKLSDNEIKKEFFDLLYYFTEFPEEVCSDNEKNNIISENFIKKMVNKIKKIG